MVGAERRCGVVWVRVWVCMHPASLLLPPAPATPASPSCVAAPFETLAWPRIVQAPPLPRTLSLVASSVSCALCCAEVVRGSFRGSSVANARDSRGRAPAAAGRQAACRQESQTRGCFVLGQGRWGTELAEGLKLCCRRQTQHCQAQPSLSRGPPGLLDRAGWYAGRPEPPNPTHLQRGQGAQRERHGEALGRTLKGKQGKQRYEENPGEGAEKRCPSPGSSQHQCGWCHLTPMAAALCFHYSSSERSRGTSATARPIAVVADSLAGAAGTDTSLCLACPGCYTFNRKRPQPLSCPATHDPLTSVACAAGTLRTPVGCPPPLAAGLLCGKLPQPLLQRLDIHPSSCRHEHAADPQLGHLQVGRVCWDTGGLECTFFYTKQGGAGAVC